MQFQYKASILRRVFICGALIGLLFGAQYAMAQQRQFTQAELVIIHQKLKKLEAMELKATLDQKIIDNLAAQLSDYKLILAAKDKQLQNLQITIDTLNPVLDVQRKALDAALKSSQWNWTSFSIGSLAGVVLGGIITGLAVYYSHK